jgi:hypothetical protein
MPTYTGVSSKTLRSRSSYRTDLTTMLRDPANTIWSTTAMNMCLDEALDLVQAHFPPVRQTTIDGSTSLMFALPVDCVRVLSVHVADEALVGVQDPPLFVPVRYEVRRQYFLMSELASPGSEDLSELKLVLLDPVTADLTMYVEYVAAKALWGSWSTIGSGVDTATTTDLNPAQLGEGLALRLFWAEARVAAYRYGMQLIPSDGGREFGRGLEAALEQRDDVLAMIQRPGVAGIRHTLFG